jgi:hypothetical protein
MWSLLRCYKWDTLRFQSWKPVSGARVLREQEPLSTEAEDIVGIRHQATTSKDTAN